MSYAVSPTRLLLIEDDVRLCRLVKDYLEPMGYAVSMAHNGPAGLQLALKETFQAIMSFILEQQKLVEPLYQLDQDGKLSGDGELGLQGRAFLEGQLMKSSQLLGDIWYSAWQQSPPDTYLKSQLARRKGKETQSPRHQVPEKSQTTSSRGE